MCRNVSGSSRETLFVHFVHLCQATFLICMATYIELFLEGKDAFGDADFVDRNKCYHFCDEEKVLKGEELVYAFDLLLFSNREFCGVQKAYVVIDVDCCGGNIKVTDGSNMYEEYVPYSDVPDEDFHYYVCETLGSLLKQVVVDIAKDIIESDLNL